MLFEYATTPLTNFKTIAVTAPYGPVSKSNLAMLDVEVFVGHGLRLICTYAGFKIEHGILPAELLPEFCPSLPDLRLDFGHVFR
jgi:hypothetical protein